MRVSKKILQAVAWLVLIGVLFAAGCAFGQNVELRPSITADLPLVGVGRAETETATVSIYTSPVCRDEYHSVWHYTEGDGEPPEWYDPDEEMAVEWTAPERHDGGCPDWNVDTTLWGWDGHSCEAWEFETFVRIAYLEVWGSSEECCKAVVDAILALWDSGYYGNTLFETLSAVTETGWYAFSTYPGMWSATYDSDGLDEMRTLCMERFTNGYEYDAPFFRTDYYHPWAVDAYHIDNVYFSYSPWMK
jgi:hypothetical protein